MKLSQLLKAWDMLHVMDVGEVGLCDLDKALTEAGVIIENDCNPCQPASQQADAADSLCRECGSETDGGELACPECGHIVGCLAPLCDFRSKSKVIAG